MDTLAQLLVRLAALLLAPAILVSSAAAGTSAGRDLRPDLVTRAPAKIYVQVTRGGRRFIRFSNEVENVGIGPLELRPRADDCNGNGVLADDRTSFQRIYRDANGDGAFTRGVDVRFRTRRAGCSLFHPAHKHWHFQALAEYTLQAAGPQPGTPIEGKKTSVCVVDTKRRLVEPGSPRRRYYGSGAQRCRRDSVGGISIGWGDIYGARVSGQELDATALADGVYCLVSRADPENRLQESNERNNIRTTRIVLRRETLEWQPYRRC